MMEKKVLSIITINYNNKLGLIKTIESVVAQNCPCYEYIIVDGFSNDGSKEIINDYSSKYNIIWISEPDNGIYNAMNKGVQLAHCNYCLFLNSGDLLRDNHVIAQVMPYLETNDIDIFSGIGFTDEFVWYPPKNEDLSLSFFLKKSLNHQSTFIKKDLLLRNPYNEHLKIVSDSEFFFKTLIMEDASYLDIPIEICFCEKAGESSDLEKSLTERYKAIKSLLPNRLNADVNFLIKNYNPLCIKFGNFVYRPFLRKLYGVFKRKKIRK